MSRKHHRYGLALAALLTSACRGEMPPDPPPAPRPLGAPCALDADCTAGLACWQSDLIGDPWCTRDCAIDDDCPLGARCADVEPNLEGEGWIRKCAPACTREPGTRGGCPAGFSCEGDGVCEPNACASDAECFDGATCEASSGRCRSGGNPAQTADGPCVEDADCRAPSGVCLSDECYHLDCDLGGDYACAAGEVCFAYFPGDQTTPSYRCKRACEAGLDATSPTEPGACEPGEICWPPERAVYPPVPSGHCDGPLAGEFVPGDPSARIGDPCTSVADCPNPLGYGYCSERSGCQLIACAVAAFGGRDPCGAGAICYHEDPPPAGVTPDEAAIFRAGLCLRLCSDVDPCPSGRTCSEVGCV